VENFFSLTQEDPILLNLPPAIRRRLWIECFYIRPLWMENWTTVFYSHS